ncbi:MAG: alpha/beta fold hydrolase [Noviherbaspirillum sp.]
MNPDLFPDTPAPFDEGHLASGDGHLIWYAQYGSRDGIPLLWLHGGPGSASSLRQLHLVDLTRYRVLLSDQRGCGRSLPLGGLQRNDTRMLVGDIARLHAHLRLGPMVVGGGSWGAALALAYAASHGASVAALLLRAPFLATREEIEGFFAPPADRPQDDWEEFAALAPPSQRRRLLPWLAQQLASASQEERERIARGWRLYELRLESGGAAPQPLVDDALIARYRVQAHYLLHECFLDPGAVLAAARATHGLPAAILHGDADLVCPPHNARLLQRCLPESRVCMVEGAGHEPFHPGMASALTQALDCYAHNRTFEGWGIRHE